VAVNHCDDFAFGLCGFVIVGIDDELVVTDCCVRAWSVDLAAFANDDQPACLSRHFLHGML
jgi:hypothetical protein